MSVRYYTPDSVLKTDRLSSRYSYNGQAVFREGETVDGGQKSFVSLAQSRSGLQFNTHQGTSVDSGYVDNGQEEPQEKGKRKIKIAWEAEEMLPCSYVSPKAHLIKSPSALSISSYVETVSWNSDTDEMIERALATCKPYRRRVQPAREVYKLPSGSATSESNDESARARDEISYYSADDEASDGATPTNQANRRKRFVHVNEKTREDYLADDSDGVVEWHGCSGIFQEVGDRVHSSDDIERESSASTDWQSLSSFSYYENYGQMGLGDYLESRGDLDGVHKEDLLLDLAWVESLVPSESSSTEDESSERTPKAEDAATAKARNAKRKKDGRIRRFIKVLRKMLCSCCCRRDDDGDDRVDEVSRTK